MLEFPAQFINSFKHILKPTKMPYQFISNENRRRIVESYFQEHNPSEISIMTGFRKKSVEVIMSKYKKVRLLKER